MKLTALAFALALGISSLCLAADDPFQGWTPEQLKTKILQLQKQVDELKSTGNAAMGSAAPSSPLAAAKAASADLKVDDFEGEMASLGGQWWTGKDDKMGSTIAPDPFVHEKGGADGKGYCGHIHGKLGANKEPWAWAAMSLSLPDGDLRGYKAVEFWAKGDGKVHNVKLDKKSVTDFASFSATFTAPAKWTKVTVPFSDFKQPDWGNKVDATFGDVEKLSFYPTTFESSYDFSIDNIKFIKQ